MSDTKTIPYDTNKNPVLRICLLIGLVTAIVVGSMGFIFYLGNDMVATHAPLVDAAAEIKLQATTAHLWLEEIVSGDRSEKVEDVLEHIDRADWYAKAMLAGGQSDEGKIAPLRNTKLQSEIYEVREKLSEFRKITDQRLRADADAGIGSEIDRQYDSVFRDFVQQADSVEKQLKEMIKRDLAVFRIVQLLLIAFCLVVMFVVGTAFSRFVHGRIRDELALQAANQQLSASEQQLRASNQQLSAGEQQLKAANQQLAAGEQELRRERDKARKYLDVAGVMLVAIDQDKHVDLINKKGCDILGYDEDEILGKNWFECFVPGRLRNDVISGFRKLMSGEVEPIEYYENPVLTKNGEERLISWHNTVLRNDEGRIVYTLSSGEDITDRKREEESLRKSQQTSNDIFKTIPAGLFIYQYEAPDRLIFLDGNPEAERLTGIRVEDWIGREFNEIWTGARESGINKYFLDPMKTGKTYETEDLYYKDERLEGAFRIRAFRLPGERLAVAFENITERKKKEKELADYRNKLRSLVSELTIAEDRERKNIASLLHDDILQKLALSKMKLSMLRETFTSSEQLGTLDNVHGYVSEMFEDMRSLTLDLCPPVLYDIGLEAAVRDWIQKEVMEKHEIEVGFETQGEPLRLPEDLRVGLYRAIREVLINVLKHAKAKNVAVRLANLGNSVKVEVLDDGIGFEQAAQETDAESTSGLGMFTVRERLEHFGGSLHTESAPGKGTRVEMTAALAVR